MARIRIIIGNDEIEREYDVEGNITITQSTNIHRYASLDDMNSELIADNSPHTVSIHIEGLITGETNRPAINKKENKEKKINEIKTMSDKLNYKFRNKKC